MRYFLSDLFRRYVNRAQSPISRQQRARQAAGTSVLSRTILRLISESETSISTSSDRVGGTLVVLVRQTPSMRGVGFGENSGAIASKNPSVYPSLVKL